MKGRMQMSNRKLVLATMLFIVVAGIVCPQRVLAVESKEIDSPAISQASEEFSSCLKSVVEVQKYDRSIHIMAMLLVGFGFLMVFVKKYGRSAVTATYLLVSVAIPVYFIVNSLGMFGESAPIEIERLILAEFAAASLLICAGAVLGRLKMIQYMVLGIFFILCYMLNEWIVLGGGLGIIDGGFADTGGSIVIHAFGALFGLGVVKTMTTKKEFAEPIESDATSDRFSMLGSMVLWLFWPSFCAALVVPEQIPHTVVNVVLALCGATVATYFSSLALRGGKISIADIANAALAGGVAIGSTCDHASHPAAFVIGILSGVLSVVGFAVIQNKLQGRVKSVDTCGVLNLHGWPGLMGGIAAVFVVDGINKSTQLKGIGISIVIALVAGYITGKILSTFGRRTQAYVDFEEFVEAEA
jgi:ammonium transporter Rh